MSISNSGKSMRLTVPVTTSKTASAMAAFISSELSMISRKWCIEKKKTDKPILPIAEKILDILQSQSLDARELQNITKDSPDDVIFALQQLLENNRIALQSNNQYTLK